VIAPDLGEVIAHMRRVDATGCDEQGDWPGGAWTRTLSLPLVFDANHVIVLEHGFGLSANDLAAAADEIQADLPNRIVEFVASEESADLAAGLSAAGWREDPLGVMVRHREPDRRVDTASVRVVDETAMEPARTASLSAEKWANGDAVAQIRRKHERTGRGVPTTHLALLEDDRIVSYCDLYKIDGDVAQIESVATLPGYRRRGCARATVTKALELAEDRRVVFLTMDPNDWPQELYAKLGFDTIGRLHRFRRALPGSH
jgi:ribosomal protein S18 acetylase RimI-like enzyme